MSEIMTDSQRRASINTNCSREAPSAGFHNSMAMEIEPLFFGFLPRDWNDEIQVAAARIRSASDQGCLTRAGDSSVSLETVENLVTPFGPTLVDKYFKHVHPTYPIILEDSFRSAYRERKGLSALLLGTVYLAALKWLEPESGIQTLRPPDAAGLETLVCKSLNESLSQPDLDTLQAGLLLSQKSSIFTPRLMAQLVTAGFDLGLHQDCSRWQMAYWEKGLRKRLAWALYMQDKWCALVHGRPSHIFMSNWTVTDLTLDDFDNATRSAVHGASFASSPSPSSPSDLVFGYIYFSQFVALTRILSDIIESFYTLEANRNFSTTREQLTHTILSKAKPIQIQLKDWFAQLPAELKVDSDCVMEAGANGGIYLAYFATEIALHRCIIRSISPETTDQYLAHICRSAAKTRLISAMDFVNRLRPVHLRAFWPAAAKTNFALIGAFGVLLRTTAHTQEEEEFYKARLREYRWTLGVNRKHAEFLDFAIGSLDGVARLLLNEPQKPGFQEFMNSSSFSPSLDVDMMNCRRTRLSEQSAGPSNDSRHGDSYYGSDEYEHRPVCNGMYSRLGFSSTKSGLISPAASASSASTNRDYGEGRGRLKARHTLTN
ncbi:Fungal specific transcription factor [Microsporum ferrugineum]